MESTINERLRDYIYAKKLSVNSFSKTVGLSQTTLNQQVNGTSKVSTEVLTAIADTYPDANMRWFLTGKGEMESKSITQTNTQGDNVVRNINTNTASVDTLFNIIKNLQEENASLIKMLSNQA